MESEHRVIIALLPWNLLCVVKDRSLKPKKPD